jgi:hypothetical protein
MKEQLLHPKHPERICWGCDRYCPADDLACGNGTIRTAHLVELFGDDWLDWAERRASGGKARATALPQAAAIVSPRS